VTSAVLVVVIAGALGGALLVTGSVGVVSADDVNADDTSDENEPPLAEAGLDQEVPVNATVYLDATGSRDPDGTVASYEWSIERPDGNQIEPACVDCPRTEFQVTTNGTYEVTVTVTDDDGASSSDTLYVDANAVETPSVEVSGPTDITANTSTTYSASAEGGESALMNVEWEIDDSETADRELSGDSATDDLRVALSPGTHEVTVRVVTEMGRTATATLTVDVADRPDRPCERATWNRTDGHWNAEPCAPPTSGDTELGGISLGVACYNDQSHDAQTWEDENPTEEYGCENDRIIGGETPSIRDSTGDGTLQIGNFTLSESQIERFAAQNEGVTLDSDSSGFGTLEFASQEAYTEAIGTSSIHADNILEIDITGGQSSFGAWGSSSESGDLNENQAVDPKSEEAETKVPANYQNVFENRATNNDNSRVSGSDGNSGGNANSSSNEGNSDGGSSSSGDSGGSTDSSDGGNGRVPGRYQ
jgi:hypothetical protein